MNDTKLLPADPKLTAYALGELEGEEQTAVETAVNTDPNLRAAVEDIRAMAGRLTAALEAEPVEEAARPEAQPAKAKGKVLQFPQLYFVIGGLAAACFAVVFSLRQGEFEAKEKVRLQVRAEQASAAAKVAQESKARAATIQMPEAAATLASADSTEQAVQLSPFSERAGGKADLLRTSEQLWVRKKEGKHEVTFGVERMALRAPPVGLGVAAALLGGRNQPNTEAYAYQAESDFLRVAQNPLSTFSIDVDTASYANVRRFLQAGRRPPADAVRIEELVNYFPYRYAAPPARGAPFAASMEVASAPWAPEHRLVRIGLKGREVSAAQRGPANLVFLLDVSGSMNEPNKLPLVKESMRLLLGKLRPNDRVAIVVYAGASGLALPSTPVKKSAEILAALDGLTAGGSTNGAMGLELAYDVAKANFVAGGLNRVILCTDGDFNVGVTSEGELTRLIGEKAKSGVFLTVLGFGMGNYKDATLEKLADKGNGNYGYIDTRREAEKLLVEQVNGTLLTIAKDVKLQVEFNPAKVASYRLIGYENRLLKKEDFNNDAVNAGEIGAGHTFTALYEIVAAGAEKGEMRGVQGEVDALKYQRVVKARGEGAASPGASDELLTLKVRYKEPAGDVSRKLEFPLVDRGARFAEASHDFRFAAAVAGFGMILRDSPHKGAATLNDVATWARAATDEDVGGYRGEFVGLVQQAEAVLQ